jgi:phosphatidylserine decarboxylase
MANLSDRAFVALQRAVPQHALSRFVGWLARASVPWISVPFIRLFARAYRVDLTEAVADSLDDYATFNEFFTRRLKPGARPLAGDELTAVSPADGVLSQAGRITAGRLLQAKGHTYALDALLGGDPDFLNARSFEGGHFATVYLAPRDYHRVHLPLAGRLIGTRVVPGALYSVNATTETHIEGLFARNERLVCHFETDFGDMVVVLVGAMIVAGIETVWPGPASPYQRLETTRYARLPYARGAEIGRFLLASTVIVCLPPAPVALASGLRSGSTMRMGQALFSPVR